MSLLAFFLIASGGFSGCQSSANNQLPALRDPSLIHLNQIGFSPASPKVAVVQAADAETFELRNQDLTETFYQGMLDSVAISPYSGKSSRVADFSSFDQTGSYVLVVPGVGISHPFVIGDQVLFPMAVASLKAFYYQRASLDLPETYAGKWARKGGHPDDRVMIHASAASSGRPTGSLIASPRGWYDAGDYNKYIVNSGITTATLLSLYEDFPAYFDTLGINIPEQHNEVPDLLDEILWNLRWMLSMQDTEDGGVYHKLTTPNFEGMVAPIEARQQRYVVQKGTAATLNFAGVTAQAARIFAAWESSLPGLADSCLQAARLAWEWAEAHPDVRYDQSAMNKQFSPPIVTGAYGGNHLPGAKSWAAIELYLSTQDTSYLRNWKPLKDEEVTVPGWSNVGMLGYYSLLRCASRLPEDFQPRLDTIRRQVMGLATALAAGSATHPYRTPMGGRVSDYVWGSSAVAANQGILLLQAYRMSENPALWEAALANMDYLLGRNATGYSFVTGFGSRTPLDPHHRLAKADGIAEPLPGFLAGGPNPGKQDGCNYPSDAADECYVDDVCSYASNEIAINWNAPLVYLAFALDRLHQP